MAIARGEITITELYDGDNFYRAWADTPDGSGSSFTTEESNRAYLGVYSGREEPTHYSQYKWSRIRGESAITAILSNDSHQIGTDENGDYGNYTGAKTTVAVFQGGEDDTSNWKVDKIEIEPAGAVTGEIIDTYTYKVVDLKTDEASVTFKLTHKNGEYSPLEKTFTLSKNKQGISGQHATSYFLSFNDTALKKFRETGTMEPAELMMQGMSIKADQKPVPQSGYFKIYEQSEIALDRDQYEQAYMDGKLDEEELYVISEKNYPLILTYTSKEPEERLTYEYTDLINIMSIKVYWYLDADFEELIDVQTISITSDGEKGDPGENAPLIKLSGDTQVIKISEDGVKTPNSSFTVTGKSLYTDIEKWEYAVNGGSFSTNLPAGVARSNNIVTINPGAINFNTLSIQATGAGVSDTFTVAQIADGLNAYTVLLSNESHTFQADTQKAVVSSAKTDILAYRGTKRMPVSVQSVTGLPTKGMTHTVSNNGKDNASITFNVTTLLTSPSGLVSINLEIDGQQITKEFSYALSFKGDTGESGKDAISAVLTNESITFAADKDGVVQNYVGNTGDFLLMEGTVNKSADTNTKFSIVNQTNVSATIDDDNGSYIISSMEDGVSVTTGQVTFRATYKGTIIDKTVTISKSIAGQTGDKGDPGAPGGKGDPGAPGAPATSYWLTSSVDTITVKYNGDYDPKTITYYGHSKTGSNNTQNYDGRFIIQTSIDGVNFTEAYRSQTNVNKVDFSVPEDVLFIKAKFYQAGGTTYLLDEQTTPILHSADGLKGVGLEDKDYQVGTEIFTDKADDSVVHVDIDGKSYQHAGSGKNLFNLRELNSITPTSWVVGAYVYEFKLKPNTEYTLSSNVPTQGHTEKTILYFNGSGTLSNGVYEGKSSTQTTDDEGYVYVAVPTDREHTAPLMNGNYWVQLEEGSVATAYEPPAPTPDYPIEIHNLNDFDVVSSVGKRNLLIGRQNGNYRLSSNNGNTNPIIYKSYEDYDSVMLTDGNQLSTYSSEWLTLEKGKEYTSSMYVYSPVKLDLSIIGYSGNVWTTVPANTWIRLSNTFIGTGENRPTIMLFSTNAEALNHEIFYNRIKLEEGEISSYSPAPEDITPDTDHPLIDKINLSLSEPLRNVYDVKDRLFRDSDGLWKIERSVGEEVFENGDKWNNDYLYERETSAVYGISYANASYMKEKGIISLSHVPDDRIGAGADENEGWLQTNPRLRIRLQHSVIGTTQPSVSAFKNWLKNEHDNGTPLTIVYELAEPTIEILDQELQDKLSNLRSFQDSNYVYTIINNKTDTISEKLKPTLHATFKGGGYYARWKTAHDLEKTTEYIEQEIERTQNTAGIQVGLKVGYSGFTTRNANSVYLCGMEYNYTTGKMQLVDEPGKIYIRHLGETHPVPNQPLNTTGLPSNTTAYITYDHAKKSVYYVYFETKLSSEGIESKRWRDISGNTIMLNESLFAIGEVST